MSSKILQRYYQWHAPIYDWTRWAFLFGRRQLMQKIATIAMPTPKSILEVGCGTGQNLLALAKIFPYADIVGCDLSADMLQRAKQKLARTSGITSPHRIQLKHAAIEDLPAHRFDLIVCSYMLSMTGPELETMVASLRRQLSPNGRLAVVDFDRSNVDWFGRWMARNHVRMDGSLSRALGGMAQVDETLAKDAFGLWRWLLWIGR